MTPGERYLMRELKRFTMTPKQWYNLGPCTRRAIALKRYCFGRRVEDES